jgi:hypothetical protein
MLIPTIIPNGKFAGARVVDLDTSDLCFLVRGRGANPILHRLIERELGRRVKRRAAIYRGRRIRK